MICRHWAMSLKLIHLMNSRDTTHIEPYIILTGDNVLVRCWRSWRKPRERIRPNLIPSSPCLYIWKLLYTEKSASICRYNWPLRRIVFNFNIILTSKWMSFKSQWGGSDWIGCRHCHMTWTSLTMEYGVMLYYKKGKLVVWLFDSGYLKLLFQLRRLSGRALKETRKCSCMVSRQVFRSSCCVLNVQEFAWYTEEFVVNGTTAKSPSEYSLYRNLENSLRGITNYWLIRMPSSGMWRDVGLLLTDFWEERVSSVLTAEEITLARKSIGP
jgi:hypothetical protein